MSKSNRRQAGQQLCMLRLVPVGGELIGRADDDGIALECQWLGRLQPRSKRLFRKLAARSIEDARPDFRRRERHERMWITRGGGGAKLSEPCGKSKRRSAPLVVPEQTCDQAAVEALHVA